MKRYTNKRKTKGEGEIAQDEMGNRDDTTGRASRLDQQSACMPAPDHENRRGRRRRAKTPFPPLLEIDQIYYCPTVECQRVRRMGGVLVRSGERGRCVIGYLRRRIFPLGNNRRGSSSVWRCCRGIKIDLLFTALFSTTLLRLRLELSLQNYHNGV